MLFLSVVRNHLKLSHSIPAKSLANGSRTMENAMVQQILESIELCGRFGCRTRQSFAGLTRIDVWRRTTLRLNYGTLAVALFFAVVFATHAWGMPWTIQHIAGLAIAAPSFLLFVLARIQLGDAFSVEAKATTLVTTGLYSRIRNPIYTFGGLMIAGVMIWANNPWLLLCFVVLIPLQVLRSRKEERVLTEKFGEAYVEYKRQTWF
jgi:protein-S-isoprenylcysteine O-methyltransferase Ste14